MRYVVTNVRLEESMFRTLKLRALERGVPASLLIREALEKYLTTPEMSKAEWKHAMEDFLKVCGVRSKGKALRTGSTDIDDVLYGPRRSKPKER